PLEFAPTVEQCGVAEHSTLPFLSHGRVLATSPLRPAYPLSLLDQLYSHAQIRDGGHYIPRRQRQGRPDQSITRRIEGHVNICRRYMRPNRHPVPGEG